MILSEETRGVRLAKNKNDIVFDHALIIYTSIEQLKNKISYTDIAFNLMPEYFTLGDL